MHLFIIAFREPDLPTDENVWMELYWADDIIHAQKQARVAHPDTPQTAFGIVPDNYIRIPE